MSQLKAILSTTAILATLSVLPKIITFVKDIFIAAKFGTSNTLDIYLMALVVMTIPVTIIAASLQTTLIPELIKKKNNQGPSLTTKTIKLTLVLLLLFLPIWLVVIPYILDLLYSGNYTESLDALMTACYWLIPYYFINGFNLIAYGAIQAGKTFWPNAIFPGLIPLTIIFFLVSTNVYNLQLLVIGTSVGILLEGGTLMLMLKKMGLISRIDSCDSTSSIVLKNAKPLIIGAIITAFSPFFDQLLAFRLGEGAISALSYGFKIPTAMAAIITISLGVVILPYFSKTIDERKWDECQNIYMKLIIIVIIIGLIPVTVCLYYSEDIIRIAFERGNFTERNTNDVAEVMSIYFYQIAFMSIVVISMKLLTAVSKTTTISIVFSMQLMLSISFSFLLSSKIGVKGIAVGSTLAYGLSALVFFILSLKKLKSHTMKKN